MLPKTTPSILHEPKEKQGGFPRWLLTEIHDDFMTQSHEKSDLSPALKGMLLKDEIGRSKNNPPWSLVEHVIRELDPGRFNSFVCLSVRGNTYVQCLRGFNGWHLEWRITNPSGSYVHYRACYPGASKKSFELKKHNHVSPGQHRDLLNLDDVVDAFRFFHQNHGLLPWLKWRVLDI